MQTQTAHTIRQVIQVLEGIAADVEQARLEATQRRAVTAEYLTRRFCYLVDTEGKNADAAIALLHLRYRDQAPEAFEQFLAEIREASWAGWEFVEGMAS